MDEDSALSSGLGWLVGLAVTAMAIVAVVHYLRSVARDPAVLLLPAAGFCAGWMVAFLLSYTAAQSVVGGVVLGGVGLLLSFTAV